MKIESDQVVKCRKCRNGDFYIDSYTGGHGFECLKYDELKELIGEVLVETLINRFNLKGNSRKLVEFLGEIILDDFFECKVYIDCPLFEERTKKTRGQTRFSKSRKIEPYTLEEHETEKEKEES